MSRPPCHTPHGIPAFPSLRAQFKMAKEIDQQSKAAGFNQMALDQTARQGYGNAQFEANSEEGLAVVDEFYDKEGNKQDHVHDLPNVQNIQHELKRSVRVVKS